MSNDNQDEASSGNTRSGVFGKVIPICVSTSLDPLEMTSYRQVPTILSIRTPDRYSCRIPFTEYLFRALAERNMTWRDIMHAIADIRVGINRTQAGELWNTSPLTDLQKALYSNLKVKLPPQVWAYKVEKTL